MKLNLCSFSNILLSFALINSNDIQIFTYHRKLQPAGFTDWIFSIGALLRWWIDGFCHRQGSKIMLRFLMQQLQQWGSLCKTGRGPLISCISSISGYCQDWPDGTGCPYFWSTFSTIRTIFHFYFRISARQIRTWATFSIPVFFTLIWLNVCIGRPTRVRPEVVLSHSNIQLNHWSCWIKSFGSFWRISW